MPEQSRLSLTRNPDELPSELLEEYEPEGQEPVGEGAFAIVRLARHRRSGELFALKCVEKHPLQIRNMLGQMQREVHIHQALRHPNILRLEKVFDDDQYVFMLLEYCEKGNLRLLVDRSPMRRLPEPRAAHYFQQIVNGVNCMHRHAYVHRDLKLENMLLTARDGRDELKICDFGWSAMVEGDKLLKTTCGTTTYWAPEIWEGNAQNEGVDMWSLGCMLYEMLAGQPPFLSHDKHDLHRRVMQGHFPCPAWFSNEARACVRGLLQRDPQQRTRCADLQRHPWLVKHRRQAPAPGPAQCPSEQPALPQPPPPPPPPPQQPPTGFAPSRDQSLLFEEERERVLPPPPPPLGRMPGQQYLQQPHSQQQQQQQQHSLQLHGPPPRQSVVLPVPRVLSDARSAPNSAAAPPGMEIVRAPRTSLAAPSRPHQPGGPERRIAWDLPAATPAGGGSAPSPRVPSYDDPSRDAGAMPAQLRQGRQGAGGYPVSGRAVDGHSSRSPTVRGGGGGVGGRSSVASPSRSRPGPGGPPRGAETFTSPRHPSPGPEVRSRGAHRHSVSPVHNGPWVTGSAARAHSEAPSLANGAHGPGGACVGGGGGPAGASSMIQAAAGSPLATRVPASASFGPMHLHGGMPGRRVQLPSTQSFPSQVFSSGVVAPVGSVLVPGSKSQSFSVQSPKGAFMHPAVLAAGAMPRNPVAHVAGAAPRSPRGLHGQVNAPPPQLTRNGSGNHVGAVPIMRGVAAAAAAGIRAWGFA